jgi:hypothetical protein
MSRRSVVPAVLVPAALVIVVAGCATTGLSPREVRGQDFSTYTMALYDLPGSGDAQAAAAAKPLRVPARVAVAQVGEVAPADAVLETLLKHPNLFASAQPMPGVMDVGGQVDYRGDAQAYQVQARRTAHAHVDRMRRFARDIGAQYLFIYGGTIDRATTNTPMSAADITIVGAFLVPSKRIQGTAKASGALVDVETGRVVLSVSADAQHDRMAPSFAQQNGELKLLTQLRDEAVLGLAKSLVEQMKSHGSAVGG